jgi:NADH-quinone oxidoreductase subunit C
MSGEKDLEQLKKEAAAKAKAAAAAKAKAQAQGAQVSAPEKPAATEQPATETTATEQPAQSVGDEKAKAAAAAKAKAAAAAKAKAAALAKQGGDEAPAPAGDDEKAKAIAAAKAKAAAAAKAKAAASGGAAAGDDEKAKAIAAAKAKAAAAAAAKAKSGGATAGDDDKAKAIAAAKAKAAAAAAAKGAGAKADAGTPVVEEAKPSPNQHYLDKYVKVIGEHLGTDVLEQSYINNLSNDVPTLVAKQDTYYKVAQFLKYNEQLGFDYVSELHGTDFITHMEVYVHFYSYKNRQSVALKVKLDRNNPQIESIVPLWPGADWPECEAYDLLGIKFNGHPHLHRMLLGDDWIGHPLRKDYEQYDVEV